MLYGVFNKGLYTVDVTVRGVYGADGGGHHWAPPVNGHYAPGSTANVLHSSMATPVCHCQITLSLTVTASGTLDMSSLAWPVCV